MLAEGEKGGYNGARGAIDAVLQRSAVASNSKARTYTGKGKEFLIERSPACRCRGLDRRKQRGAEDIRGNMTWVGLRGA